MALTFYTQNTVFIDNISQSHDVFDVHWKGDEYEVFVNPQDADDLKVICDVFLSIPIVGMNWKKLLVTFLRMVIYSVITMRFMVMKKAIKW